MQSFAKGSDSLELIVTDALISLIRKNSIHLIYIKIIKSNKVCTQMRIYDPSFRPVYLLGQSADTNLSQHVADRHMER
jgi:hypothetical protein